MQTMLPSRAIASCVGWLFVCMLAMSRLAQAAEAPGDECPVSQPITAPIKPRVRPPRPSAPGPAFVHADSIQSVDSDVIELKGKADATRDGERIDADYLRYNRATGQVDATGNVTLSQPDGAQFRVGEAHLDLDTHVGFADAGTYKLPERQGRGEMSRIDFLDADHTRISEMRYTTCPLGHDDWALRARQLDLDTAKNVGVARNATLDLFGLPVLYMPYFRFPLGQERESGFLVPQFGYGSTLGTVVATPYYLNLAPNYDATLTPRIMTERGVQLQSEFRYLGRGFEGRLEAEYLPNDKVTDDSRAAGALIHRQRFNPYWSAAVDLRGVSDKNYLSDFGDRLNVTSQSFLPQNAQIDYRGTNWTFSARASDYQTVDPTIDPLTRPYARLPQLTLAGGSGPTASGPQYRFDSELVNFQRDIGVTGLRSNLNPSMRFPLTPVYGFLTPEVGVHNIAYRLDDAPESNPSVTAPYASLDSGLFFEREVHLGGSAFDQTLEPRLYYLYVPHRPQDDLPNFDTSIPDFTFANLFRNNRFVGGDRIGDANQLTVALTSRLFDQSNGAERLRTSIGRIHYFDDRRVNLPPGTVTNAGSDIAAEAVAWIVRSWHARAAVQWSPDDDHSTRSNFYVQYQPAVDRILNVGYRLARDLPDPVLGTTGVRQVDVSTEWPLVGPWTLRARSLYSLRDNENVESYVGAQYNSCCWVFRVFAARRLVQTTVNGIAGTEQRGGISIEFELKGLGNSHSAFESPLRQSLFSFPTTEPTPVPPSP
ncbi:MAG: LPS-assembly protein LptD [Sulfurifustis sp.]